jgi:hypothetical protein
MRTISRTLAHATCKADVQRLVHIADIVHEELERAVLGARLHFVGASTEAQRYCIRSMLLSIGPLQRATHANDNWRAPLEKIQYLP